MVPKHLRKSDESLGSNQECLMAALIELQNKIINDKSILRQPIDTGVRGVKDLIKAIVGGTQELQELLLNECTIIYECKICRNLFRSLANFISHKRIYCIKNFSFFPDETTKEEKEIVEENITESEKVNCNNEVNLTDAKVWLSSDTIVPNNVKTEKNLKPTSPLKINRKCDIAKIADGLRQKTRKENLQSPETWARPMFHLDVDEKVMIRRSHSQNHFFPSDNINNSFLNNFYQNGKKLNDRENLSIEKVSSCNEAVLQEDGKFRVTPQGTQLENNKNLKNFTCTICKTHFITKQVLSRHVQIHHKERICYPCPICRTFFPSPSSTYRHLSKDHHKTEQQIRRLRPKVLAKASKRKLIDGIRNKQEDVNNDRKFIQTFVGNEGVLSCNNCGKLFNRQAVLRVHLTSCKFKKMYTCNTIPEKKNRVSQNNGLPVKSTIQKSGILVRKDYCKKLNCDSVKTTNWKRPKKPPLIE
ncbi:hypothetical protein Phum_PHUM332850 [Pediculus humanus corporis]|uniref:C2H2-type domain-containing protein n=1 Tax=Pediculus humanus subsp. corporis TaxID=121224 RepID=E0VNB2_PEDHC|nr:uncharacterized protein Phum_PHUM332850 [Pediculus humanus corporis]EEB14868.1 hypothetical protein Phum_PHUM332850 [Pediculus humanus corporis]